MREVKHYICEICGTEYNDKIKAKQCEGSHCAPVEIEKARFIRYKNNLKGYPISVDVRMADGEVLTYRR